MSKHVLKQDQIELLTQLQSILLKMSEVAEDDQDFNQVLWDLKIFAKSIDEAACEIEAYIKEEEDETESD